MVIRMSRLHPPKSLDRHRRMYAGVLVNIPTGLELGETLPSFPQFPQLLRLAIKRAKKASQA